MGFPGSSPGKESTCSAGDPSVIPGLGNSPGEGIGYSLQYSSLENPHGQRNLVGYSPSGHKESGMTERLSTHTPTPVFLPGEFHGQRNLVGYSPLGYKESEHDWETNTINNIF